MGKTLRVLKLAVIRYPIALGDLAFIGVWSYKHTVYCVTKLVSPYIFFFVFRSAWSRTVLVTVIFKVRFQPRGSSCFYLTTD